MQTTLIDLKSKNAAIDIYDISRADHHPTSPKIGFKKTANKSIGTGESTKVKLVAPQDWYFSELNRRLMREFYQKNGIEYS
jgi:proline dehydrogenase